MFFQLSNKNNLLLIIIQLTPVFKLFFSQKTLYIIEKRYFVIVLSKKCNQNEII